MSSDEPVRVEVAHRFASASETAPSRAPPATALTLPVIRLDSGALARLVVTRDADACFRAPPFLDVERDWSCGPLMSGA